MKKIKIASLAAVALLTAAGAANAATLEINGFGASAQFDFWRSAGDAYLQSQGCTIDLTRTGVDSTGKYYVTVGTGCALKGTAPATICPPSPALPSTTACMATVVANGYDTIIFRYSSKASYAGIFALQNTADATDTNAAPPAAPFTAGVVAPATDPTKDCSNAANGSQPGSYRWFGDENSIVAGAVTKGRCLPVTLAASDVEAAAFAQTSIGQKLGPMLGTTPYSKVFAAGSVSPAGLNNALPIVVPFGMFVNKAVALNKCNSTTANAALIGQLCYQESDCGGTAGTTTYCTSTSDGAPLAANGSNANTIDNITREQAVCLFSGVCKNWGDFGSYYASQPVVTCFRHAGSGTHSTLDNEVMFKTWGAPISFNQKLPTADYGTATYTPALTPTPLVEANNVIWFNDGTPDELNCLNGNAIVGAWLTATTHAAGSMLGAVGYADADKACAGGLPANVVAIKYNGNLPSREAIRNGHYEFFTNENMYWLGSGKTGYDANVDCVTQDIANWADNPSNIVATPPSLSACRATYWASHTEMVFNRSATNAFPVKVRVNGECMQP